MAWDVGYIFLERGLLIKRMRSNVVLAILYYGTKKGITKLQVHVDLRISLFLFEIGYLLTTEDIALVETLYLF